MVRKRIEVRMPAPNDLVPTPVPVAGFGEAFEGTVVARVRQGNTILGERIFQTSMGTVLPFLGELDIEGSADGPDAILEVFGDDPRDEPERVDPGTNLVSVPIVLGSEIVPDYQGFAVHQVEKGETLSSVAREWSQYGKEVTWKQIYTANRDVLDDPDVVGVGQVLRIPR